MIFHSKLISQERTIKKDTDIFRKSKKSQISCLPEIERKQKLTAAGYDYARVQAKVNKLLS